MTEYKTLRVPADSWQVANDSKLEAETWGDFLERCSEHPPDVREFVDASELDGTPTDAFEASGDGAGLSFDDVKAACGAAIREELSEVLKR